jgi:hypothetical protein
MQRAMTGALTNTSASPKKQAMGIRANLDIGDCLKMPLVQLGKQIRPTKFSAPS